MKLVLVRHGSHVDGVLTPHGNHEIERLAQALRRRGVVPSLYISSSRPQAIGSLDVIAVVLDVHGDARHLTCQSVTSRCATPGHFEEIVQELAIEGVEPAQGS